MGFRRVLSAKKYYRIYGKNDIVNIQCLAIIYRCFNLGNHEEARNSRRDFLLMPEKLIKIENRNKLNVSIPKSIGRGWKEAATA